MTTYAPLEVNDVMPFGKFKTERIGDLIRYQTDYVVWLYEETSVELSLEVIAELEDRGLI